MVRFSPFKKSPKNADTPKSPSHADIFKQASLKRGTSKSSKQTKLKRTSAEKENFITRTKFFKGMAKRVFNDLDADGSGELDIDELYSGILMVHLQLAKFFGSAACKPPTRETVQNMFFDFDDDNSGSLNVEEFLAMCVLLVGQVSALMERNGVYCSSSKSEFIAYS